MADVRAVAETLTASEAQLWVIVEKMMRTPGDIIAAPRGMAFYIERGLAQRLESGEYAPTDLGKQVAIYLGEINA